MKTYQIPTLTIIGLIVSTHSFALPRVTEFKIIKNKVIVNLEYDSVKRSLKDLQGIFANFSVWYKPVVQCTYNDQKLIANVNIDHDYTVSTRFPNPRTVKKEKTFKVKINQLCKQGNPDSLMINGTIIY